MHLRAGGAHENAARRVFSTSVARAVPFAVSFVVFQKQWAQTRFNWPLNQEPFCPDRHSWYWAELCCHKSWRAKWSCLWLISQGGRWWDVKLQKVNLKSKSNLTNSCFFVLTSDKSKPSAVSGFKEKVSEDFREQRSSTPKQVVLLLLQIKQH